MCSLSNKLYLFSLHVPTLTFIIPTETCCVLDVNLGFFKCIYLIAWSCLRVNLQGCPLLRSLAASLYVYHCRIIFVTEELIWKCVLFFFLAVFRFICSNSYFSKAAAYDFLCLNCANTLLNAPVLQTSTMSKMIL